MSDPIPPQDTATMPPSPPRSESSEAETLAPPAPPSATATLPPVLARVAPAACDGISIPGYEILSVLGRGGMGVVYQARQTKLGRVVALKMILSGAHAGEADLARFRTEAEAIARLQHPNIVQIHEVGEQGGLPYFSLEFCGGGSLEKKLNGTPLPPQEAAALVEALARAMAAAHQKGVIHRDLKPANVLLAEDGTPKITDFGLAKKLDEAGQTASGAVMGTPSYMAPEQAGGRSKEIGPACDVYALGAILYECLTGRPPFRAAAALDTILQVVGDEPVPPSRLNSKLPRDLETICLKCLHKEAEKRYAGALDLAHDLGRFQRGEPIAARLAGVVERARKWAKRRPAVAALLVVSVFAGLTIVGVVGSAAALVYGKNRELARANVDLIEERDRAKAAEDKALTKEAEAVAAKTDLEQSNGALKLTTDDLKRSRDDLELTLARSLLRPLALQGGGQPMTEPEWDALWELATNRGGRLGYRFVEEALRTPATTRQLRDRAALALAAAGGLDAERRAEVEALLVRRLDDPAVGDEQKRDLALAAAAWDGLGSAAAGRAARQLTRAMTGTRDPFALMLLAPGLSAVAPRLEPGDAAPAAAALVQVVKDTPGPLVLLSLAQGLSALAARLEPKDAATVTAQATTALVRVLKDVRDPNVVPYLAQGLSALAAHVGPGDAAPAAAALVQAMKDTRAPHALSELAQGLAAVAARMESRDAAPVTAQAVTLLVQAMKDARNGYALPQLAQALSAVAGRLEPRDAAQAATTLLQAIKDTKGQDALGSLARGLSAVAARLDARDAAQVATALAQAMKDTTDPNASFWLAWILSAVAAGLDARDAPQVATTLAKAMKDTRDPNALSALAQGLSAVAARLEPGDAAEAAATLARAIKDTKEPGALGSRAEGLSAVAARLDDRGAAQAAATLAQAMKDTTDPNALSRLAQGLAVVAARMERQDAAPLAAQAANALARAMNDTRNPGTLRSLARGLSAVAARMEPRDAAPLAAQAAVTLVRAMKDTRDAGALPALAQGLSAVAARMEPRDAAPLTAQAATTLVRVLKDTRDPNPNALSWLAEGLAAVAAGMEARDAATVTAQAATTLVQAMKDTRDPYTVQPLAKGLSALLSAVAPAVIPPRSATAAAAVGFPAGAGHPLAALALLIPAAEPPPCRLSTQQLVELLKMPTCLGEARRMVLDQLGHRYRRTFAHAWEFVHFAKEQNLALDFTTPPQRPEPGVAAKP